MQDDSADAVAGEAEIPVADLTADEIEQYMPSTSEMVIHDRRDENEIVAVLDRHDVEQIVMEIQRRALTVWVYDIPGEGQSRLRELSYKGARDVVALMNHTGKVKIGTIPETLKLERFKEDRGFGLETFVRATIFAKDEVTGEALPGVSTEPLYMKLRASTAKKKREAGGVIPEDDRVFDIFAETKATNKAVRNALRAFIPEEAVQAVLAQYDGDSSRVLRIQTKQEQDLAELPPALTDEKAVALIDQVRAAYDEIRELGGGRGKIDFPPGQFGMWLLQAQHSHATLEELVAYVEGRRDNLVAKYAAEASS